MKQQKWEDPTEAVKEFIDGGELMADDDSDIDEGTHQFLGDQFISSTNGFGVKSADGTYADEGE